jgi:hypothetical protein
MKGIGRGRAGSAVTRQKKTASDATAARHSHNAGPEAADPAAAAAALPAPTDPAGTAPGALATAGRSLA